MAIEATAAVAAARFGFWAALATGTSTLGTFAIAIATPPLSGALCKEGCFDYPYLDIAERFPRDYLWMFPAIAARCSTWPSRRPCTPACRWEGGSSRGSGSC